MSTDVSLFNPTVNPSAVVIPNSETSNSGDRKDPFAATRSLRDVYQVIADIVQSSAKAFAVVHYVPATGSEDEQVTQIPLNPSGSRAETPLEELVSICRKAAADGDVQCRNKLSPDRILVGYPVASSCGAFETLGLIISADENSESFLDVLQRLAGSFAVWRLRDQLRRQSDLAKKSAALVELVADALQGSTQFEACQRIVSLIAHHLNLTRAAIGIRSERSHHCRLVALSDTARIDRTTRQTQSIETVMDESILLGMSTSGGDVDAIVQPGRAAEELAKEQSACVLSVPLYEESETGKGEPVGVLVAVLDSNRELRSASEFLNAAGPCLASVLSNTGGRTQGVLTRSRQIVASRRGLLSLSAAVAFALAMLVPVSHRESCDVRIEPSMRRFVSAPFDATLRDCVVGPGDLVRQGDLLATLDGRELRIQREGLQADHDQAIKKRDVAQANRNYAEARISKLDIDRIRSELDLLDLRLAQLELRSPVDGVVVTGDLDRAQGAPLTLGQSLFEIAPLDEVLAEASIPEDNIAYVKRGQHAQLRLKAYPEDEWETELIAVNPRSEIRDDENVFIAESLIANEDHRLRPGMKGTIKVDCGRRRLGWILFHSPIESINQWLWW